ncbi:MULTISPECIES: DUF6316 family protein [Pseudomonas]|jgi:hypothetical protein|uniref:DUF6316 domain-containing protein n=1 Tax=Pseudomonas gingeri TaxID=117681 RepID=A0A7Y7WCH7_9PSED|nr:MULTISPECIES: DUF6316 family protein [Pseudomonas]MCU1739284.1 DUF6316 family protein [Pseudomonas sp. 20S_6.2_Bac1]NWB46119.1 hypothetical protein [Pseudomonas gingeri]
MFGKRAQDNTEATHFRTGRVTTINGQFFFSTRENTLEGPFVSRTDAERETQVYVKRMQRSNAIKASQTL